MSIREAIEYLQEMKGCVRSDYDICGCCENWERIIKEALALLEQAKTWISVSDGLPAQLKDSYLSEWVIVSDGHDWTIARYDYRYHVWQKDHAPYDLDMKEITDWMRIEI